MKIIAECGVNFKDMEEAFKFIDKCKELNLFACKFQIFNEDNIKDAPMEYQSFLKSIMLDYGKAKDLFDYGKASMQEVFFTPMFLEAVDWLEEIGVNYYKIRFKDNKNMELIDLIDLTDKPFFISCNTPLNYLEGINLFCVPKYPASYEDYKTATNPYYRDFGFKGVSDHTPDFELFIKHSEGYEYWEKHVKLDNTQPLEDKWSVSFSQLKEVIQK